MNASISCTLKAVLLVCLVTVSNLTLRVVLVALPASNNRSSLLSTPTIQSGDADAVEATAAATSNTRQSSRFLVGIFTNGAFGVDGYVFERNRYRNYFRMFGDERICSIHEFRTNQSDDCQFIYTFVAGRKKDTNSSLPTWLMLNNNRSYSQDYIHHEDRDGEPDLTVLNIQENMNQGKSQTWFRYAAALMDELDIDYVVKMDSDCLIVLDRFFDFINQHLATANFLTYVGRLSDKAFWTTTKQYQSTDADRLIKRMKRQSVVQVYMAGELYILSKDLAKWVGDVDHTLQPWYEEIEDHDVGLRIFDHAHPIHFIRIKKLTNQFWIHPAKDELTWTLFLNRESFKKRSCLALPEPKGFVMGPLHKKKFGSHLVEIPDNATVCNES